MLFPAVRPAFSCPLYAGALLFASVFLPASGRSAPVSVPPPAAAYIQEIAIDPQQPAILYVASPEAGLYQSRDGGARWTQLRPTAGRFPCNLVQLDPRDPARVFAGGPHTGLWLSPDRGRTWQSAGLPGVTLLDLALDPHDPQRLFALTPEGVYRNEDLDTDRWRLVFSYARFVDDYLRLPGHAHYGEDDQRPWHYTRFQKLALSPHDPRVVIVGARWEGGYHRSDDGGETWRHETVSGLFRRVDRVRFDPGDPDILYAGTHHQGVFKSWNRGRSWVSLSRGLAPQKRTPYYGVYLIGGLAFSPDDPAVLYAGSDHSAWKSSDAGLSWHELGPTLTCEFTRCFAVDPQHPQIVYAGTNVGLYKSPDAGATWLSANRGFPVREIRQTCRATIDGEEFEYAVVTGQPAVFRRSLTRHTDWVSMSWMLYEPADAIRYDATAGELVLQTPHGERRSRDGGFRWDVPAVEFAPRHADAPPPETAGAPDADSQTLRVEIAGASVIDDTQVDPLYRRPPYISLQIVTPGYPRDRSAPLWSANWDRTLSGRIAVPRSILSAHRDALLYVEVRDFQRNTLTGAAPLPRDPAEILRVRVSPTALLPALSTSASDAR